MGKKIKTFDDYSNETKKTAKYPSIGQNINYPILGLTGEAGEAAEVLKKASRDTGVLVETGSDGLYILHSVEHKQLLLKELGDVLWYIDAAAKELGSSLLEVAQMNIDKTHKRLADKTLLVNKKRSKDNG